MVENLFLGREEIGSGPAGVLHQLDEIGMEQRSHELLENLAVTIPSVRTEVGTMSGGQRQQVAIARSLLGEPKVVLLDEPTAALGVRQTARCSTLIKRLRERGFGVVVISHNLADVFEVADRIFVLRLGREAGEFGREPARTRSWRDHRADGRMEASNERGRRDRRRRRRRRGPERPARELLRRFVRAISPSCASSSAWP